jgi:hypothetical protein
MWKDIKERLGFFGEIVGALMIDAGFLSTWAVIHYISDYLVAKFTAGDPSLPIQILKYTFDYSTLVVISFFVLGDIIRAARKLIDSLRKK